jgi:hypothetical protein
VSLLGATYLTYLLLAVPLVLGATRVLYRAGVMVLLDAMDADEMLVVAVNRLVALGYGLFGLGLVAALAPTPRAVRGAADVTAAALPSLAAVLLWLGVLQLSLIAGYGLLRRRRLQRDMPLPTWGPHRPPAPPFAAPFVPTVPGPWASPMSMASPVPPAGFPLVPPMPPMPPSAFPPPTGRALPPPRAWSPAPLR